MPLPLLAPQERQALLHPLNQLLGQTHDALARALHAAQRPAAATGHLRASLVPLARHYPPGSTAIAFQKLQLAAMLRLAAEAARDSEGAATASAGGLGSWAQQGTTNGSGSGGAGKRCVQAVEAVEAGQLEREAREVLRLHFGEAWG